MKSVFETSRFCWARPPPRRPPPKNCATARLHISRTRIAARPMRILDMRSIVGRAEWRRERKMAIPKLNAVILNVADKAMLKTCVQWYLKLGLELSSSEPEESAFFNTGNGALFAIHLAKTAGHS